MSTGVRSTWASRETPDGSIRTWATAATTWLTLDWVPFTVTSVVSRIGGLTWRLGGRVPVTTWTGTVFVASGSRVTVIRRGDQSRIVMSGSEDCALTFTTVGSVALGVTPLRSTQALKRSAVTRLATSAGAA